jgi:hypothetical protein
MRKPQRLQQKIDALNKQWKTLNEKLSKLRQARILETDVSQQIRLDSQIAETQHDCDEIERQLDELEEQFSQYAFDTVHKLVFINADTNDAPLCERICRLLKEEDLAEYVEFRIGQQKPEELRKAFEAWILDCDALVVIYGRVDFGWLNQIFKNVRKIVWQRPVDQPLPAYVLCDPAPEQKQLLNIGFCGISTLHYASCADEREFREFINSL